MSQEHAEELQFPDESRLSRSHGEMLSTWNEYVQLFGDFIENGGDPDGISRGLKNYFEYEVDKYGNAYFDEDERDIKDQDQGMQFVKHLLVTHYSSLAEVIMHYELRADDFRMVSAEDLQKEIDILYYNVEKQERVGVVALQGNQIDVVGTLVDFVYTSVAQSANILAQESAYVEGLERQALKENTAKIAAQAWQVGRLAVGVFAGMTMHSLAQKYLK